MEYKEMAKVMTDEEVKTCMAILIEDSVILDIERNTIQNYIRVKYRLIGDHNKGIYWISLLSNSIEDVEEKHLRHEAKLNIKIRYIKQMYKKIRQHQKLLLSQVPLNWN